MNQKEPETESNNRQPAKQSHEWQSPYPPYQNMPYVEKDDINLLELWRVLMKRKWMIMALGLIAAASSVVYSLQLPNIYRSEVVLAPVEKGKTPGGAAALLGQFGGLASMAGISLGGGSNEVNLAILKSRTFIKQIVKENELMPLLFPDKWDDEAKKWAESDPEKQPTLWGAYRLLKNILAVSTDKKSGLTTVSLQRENPEQTAEWLKLFIDTFNKHLKEQAINEAEANIAYLTNQIKETPILEMRQTLYSVIAEQTRQVMLAKSQPYFAFKVIDPPEVPDRKFKPKRSQIVILSTFVAGFMGIFLAFFLEFLRKQKEEESEEKA